MNARLKKAHEVGEVCEIRALWDEKGDCPCDSYSYVFEVIEEKENALDTVIKITGIDGH